MGAKSLAKRILSSLSKKGLDGGDRSTKQRMWEAVSEGLFDYFEDEGVPGGTNTDEKVRISDTDTTSGYLSSKLIAGANILITERNSGSDETIEIEAQLSSLSAEIDHFQPVDSTDNVFTLSFSPILGTLKVYVNSLRIFSEYSISGDELTISADIRGGDDIHADYNY